MGQKSDNLSTVVVLPETDERALCLRFRGLIRKDDHKQNLRDNLEKIVEQKGWYNMLIHYAPDYQGWEKDAADTSMNSIIDLGKFARKLAYVNPPEKKIVLLKVAAPLFGGEVRYFNENEYQSAVDWIRA